MDDSGMAGAAAIGAILRKGVFKGTTSKNRKSGVEISPTVSVDGPPRWPLPSQKLRD